MPSNQPCSRWVRERRNDALALGLGIASQYLNRPLRIRIPIPYSQHEQIDDPPIQAHHAHSIYLRRQFLENPGVLIKRVLSRLLGILRRRHGGKYGIECY